MIIDRAELVVIGGGPAGMMCAYTASSRGIDTILLEPNRQLGRKLRITGKGRCNITNNCDIKEFMRNIPCDGRFLYSALNRFSPDNTIEFFQQHGLAVKTERGNRVFPVSDNANDVAGTMAHICERAGVRVIHERAKRVHVQNGTVAGVEVDAGLIECASVCVCTGGLSYPLTGSTGDGYTFARSAGHTVTELHPSLVPLECAENYCGEMQGFSLKNVALSVYEDDKLIYKEQGEMLFTHFGVSGPLVLSASSHMRRFDSAKYRLEIDLKPALDEKKLDARILRDFEKYANREFKNALCDLAGYTMIPVLIRLSEIPEDTKVNIITREQRMRLLHIFKALPLSVIGTRPIDEAIVTAGGVNTKEINPRTMESKLVSGLYFAGEVLDVDGYTGGFNLQIAWATGYVAGNSVQKAE